ncbi:reverse transcriptase, partial [Trifolium medium]|nr:reverse transcriptase [Trifolium medium]
FLNGDLDEEIYMEQPEGYVLPGNEQKVCKLVRNKEISNFHIQDERSWAS